MGIKVPALNLDKIKNQQVDYYKSLGEEMSEQEVIKNLSYYFFEGTQEISEPEQIKKIKAQSKFSNSEYRSEHPNQIGLLNDWQSALYFKNEVEKLANPAKGQQQQPSAEELARQKQIIDSLSRENDSIAPSKNPSKQAKKPN